MGVHQGMRNQKCNQAKQNTGARSQLHRPLTPCCQRQQGDRQKEKEKTRKDCRLLVAYRLDPIVVEMITPISSKDQPHQIKSDVAYF